MNEKNNAQIIATEFTTLWADEKTDGLLNMIRDYELDHERSVFNAASYRHSDDENIYTSFIIKMHDAKDGERFFCIDKTVSATNMLSANRIEMYEVVPSHGTCAWLPKNDDRLKLC